MKENKELELERLVFFSDAIIAIAITLLALELKLNHITSQHLTFNDLLNNWQKFLAFFLSFFNIALFWKIHHQFFRFIKAIDETLLWYNVGWLLSIVLLPFSTSLISSYFFDTPAMFVYCLNIFFITLFQNQIWDYVEKRETYLKEEANSKTVSYYHVSCNVAMLNSLAAIFFSFLNPLIAFIIILLRFPMIVFFQRILRK